MGVLDELPLSFGAEEDDDDDDDDAADGTATIRCQIYCSANEYDVTYYNKRITVVGYYNTSRR